MEKTLKHDRTCVYNIGYHIVWSTKYRKQVITGMIEKTLKESLHEIAKEKGFEIKYLETVDHVSEDVIKKYIEDQKSK